MGNDTGNDLGNDMGDEIPLDRVGELMERCLALPEQEQRAELERLCRENPDLAADLRARFAFLADLGIEGAAPSADLPERLGEFRLLGRLGGGGMGVVFKAEQTSLGRTVALKVVRPELVWFPGTRERFRREIDAIARLHHPGIVPVYAAGEEKGVPYFAMELVLGCSLAEAIAALAERAPESLAGSDLLRVVRERAGATDDAARGDSRSASSLPAPFARGWVDGCVEVARQVAEALAHAHEQGLVHRDVKPSNVLLTPDGRARLVDFGLTSSQGSDRLTRSGSQLGTLHYMAPEQLRGGAIDARADVYSLGATLHELLTLRPPFDAQDRLALERRVVEGRPDPIRARNRRVSVDAETVCLHAMAPEPARRYAGARAFADDLSRLLDGRPVAARPPGRVELVARWAKHHRGATAAVLLAFLLAAGVPTGLYFLQRTHTKKVEQLLTSESKALAREKEARAAEAAANRTEKAALVDMYRSFEMVASVFRDSSTIFTEGKELTLREGVERLEKRTTEQVDAPRASAQVLSLLGQLRMIHGELNAARPLLEKSEALLRENGFATSRERATALQALGRLEHESRDEERARERFAEAIEVNRAADPADARFVAMTLAEESNTFAHRGTFPRSVELLEQALGMFQARPGNAEDLEWLVTNRAGLAQTLGLLAKSAEAEAQIARARIDLGDWASAPQRLRLVVLNAEAVIARFCDDLERADRTLLEAFDLGKSVFGPVHPFVADLLIKRAEVLVLRGDPASAEPLLAESCAMYETLYGKESSQAIRARADAEEVRSRAR